MDHSDPHSPVIRYETRAERHRVDRERARATANRLSALRLVAALALVASIGWAIDRPGPPLATVAILGCAAAFALLVRVHGRARATERECERRRVVCLRGVARVRRTWSALREPAWPRAADRSALAIDLHLVGRNSLAQLLDVVTPAVGGPRIYEWLVADPPPATTMRARQAAVHDLAARADFLEDCATAADGASTVPRRTLDAFVAWAESTPARPLGAFMRALAWIGPALAIGAIVAAAIGVKIAAALVLPTLVLNATASAIVRRRLGTLLAGVGDLPALLRPVLAVAERFDGEQADADAWRDVRDRLRQGGGLPAMRRLTTLIRWSEVRYSPMGHWALNALTQWDVHLLAQLDAWRRMSGSAVRAWFDAVGDGEALVALATLAHDNPDWAMPTVDDAMVDTLDATALGHPLFASSVRVSNPVTLGTAGSVLVISGSNMAGKTTLLRTVGVNVLLAQAGGPVCASAMRWRRARVRTSVHVRDAMEDGVSLYLAELQRLKSIVVDAQGAPALGAAPVLYLLDEVLHGTNSADRRTATRAVLARLRRAGASGIITTHDLELADDPALMADTTHLHFRERYEPGDAGPRMTFDFIARDGKADGANALALLDALDLGPLP